MKGRHREACRWRPDLFGPFFSLPLANALTYILDLSHFTPR